MNLCNIKNQFFLKSCIQRKKIAFNVKSCIFEKVAITIKSCKFVAFIKKVHLVQKNCPSYQAMFMMRQLKNSQLIRKRNNILVFKIAITKKYKKVYTIIKLSYTT